MIQKLIILALFVFVFSFAPAVSAAGLSLQIEKSLLKVGQETTVSIMLSGGEDTLGTDVVLIYDPQNLEAKEVKAGTLYPSYNPAADARIDQTIGQITISGSGGFGQPVKADGLFATVTFQAKKFGSFQVQFDYAPGVTAKTGVIDFAGNELLTEPLQPLTVQIKDQSVFEKLIAFIQNLLKIKR